MDAIPYYWKSVDWDALMRDYPPPPHFATGVGQFSADALQALQEKRFLARVAEAWQVPFYRQRWREAGLDPGDVASLDDIERIPTFTSADLKEAIAAAPPFGNHHPFGRADFGRMPIKIQTSGGTTGLPRVTLFDPVAWEVQGIQAARAFYAQGARPGDIVQVPYTNSLANAAWCATTGLFHWLGCVPVNSGSGAVTPSERQLEYALAWGVNGWFIRGEYAARLAEVAAANKIDLRRLPTKFLHSYLGTDLEGLLRKRLEEAWGAPVYDNWGTHEIGLVAFECAIQDRKHISEDTVFIETVDVEGGAKLPSGAKGSMVVTSLHRIAACRRSFATICATSWSCPSARNAPADFARANSGPSSAAPTRWSSCAAPMSFRWPVRPPCREIREPPGITSASPFTSAKACRAARR
jgi:phenylacetate-CoA ligase